MKTCFVFALLSIASLPFAVQAEKAGAAFPVTYAGGSLSLDHDKALAALVNDEVVFTQHSRRVAVPVKNITDISCGTDVRRRFGATVLGPTEDHYIGVAWTGAEGTPEKAQALLKLNRAEYREFLAALERATGIKAVNTNQVPTVVHYNL